MPDDSPRHDPPPAAHPHDTDEHASRQADAQRVAAAASGPDDPADTSAGDAAGVPVGAQDAAPASSETFPPINQ